MFVQDMNTAIAFSNLLPIQKSLRKLIQIAYKKYLQIFFIRSKILNVVTWHTMKLEMAILGYRELQQRMSDSEKPGDKSLYILQCTEVFIC